MKALSALALTLCMASPAVAAPSADLSSMQLSLSVQQKSDAIQLALGNEPLAAAAPANDTNRDLKDQVREPILRGIFSLILPGAGQWFNSDEPKDWIHLGVALGLPIVSWLVTSSLDGAAAAQAGSGNTGGAAGTYALSTVVGGVFGLANLGWHLYSGYDAYTVSQRQQPRVTFTPTDDEPAPVPRPMIKSTKTTKPAKAR